MLRLTRTAFALAVVLFGAPSQRSAAEGAPSTAAPAGPAAVARIDGDTWLTTNAMFDGMHWSSADPTHASFALWMNDSGYMPSEGKTGAVGFWTHRPDCPRTFSKITDSCGWNLGLTVTQWKSVVVGGNTIEIDGNNAAPFGRVVNTTDGEHRFIGLMSNVFGDFSGFDVTGRASWIAGIDMTADTFDIKRLPANPASAHVRSSEFTTVLDVDRDGNTVISGSVSAARAAQARAGQWATRTALHSGRAVFRFPRAYAVTPVCVANSEGQGNTVLHVSPSPSACVVKSADGSDTSMVDIIVIGNPG